MSDLSKLETIPEGLEGVELMERPPDSESWLADIEAGARQIRRMIAIDVVFDAIPPEWWLKA